MAAVRKGTGREVAHEIIKENAVAVALELRDTGAKTNPLFDRLADTELGLTRDELDACVTEPLELTGATASQIAHVVAQVKALAAADPAAAAYDPGAVL